LVSRNVDQKSIEDLYNSCAYIVSPSAIALTHLRQRFHSIQNSAIQFLDGWDEQKKADTFNIDQAAIDFWQVFVNFQAYGDSSYQAQVFKTLDVSKRLKQFYWKNGRNKLIEHWTDHNVANQREYCYREVEPFTLVIEMFRYIPLWLLDCLSNFEKAIEKGGYSNCFIDIPKDLRNALNRLATKSKVDTAIVNHNIISTVTNNFHQKFAGFDFDSLKHPLTVEFNCAMAGWRSSQQAVSKSKMHKSGKPIGRPRGSTLRNLDDDRKLVAEWKKFKCRGNGRDAFCDSKDILVNDLKKAQRNVNRSKKGAKKSL